MVGQAGLRTWSENEEVRLGMRRVGLLFFMPELGCSLKLAPRRRPLAWPAHSLLKRESGSSCFSLN